jgi:predicted TIM-barrel fold metal-dependent hydrolase
MRSVTGLLGDDILMFGSDYPHAESRFPNSVDKVLSWGEIVDQAALDRLLWDNPVRCFGEP